MKESARVITSEEIFGIPDRLPGTKITESKQKAYLRRQKSDWFAEEVDYLIKNFGDRKRRNRGKRTRPLPIKINGCEAQIRAEKKTIHRRRGHDIFYVDTSYQLVLYSQNKKRSILFNHTETRYPEYKADKFGNEVIIMRHGSRDRIATFEAANQAYWSVRFLGEQLEARSKENEGR